MSGLKNGETNSKIKTEGRNCAIDMLRILAAFMVIVNHTNSDVFQLRDPSAKLWFLSVTYFYLSKAAVPIFLMITGYLMLGKRDPWKKTMMRTGKTVLALAASGIVYALVILKDPADMAAAMHNIYRQPPSNALWYLYLYIGILLMMPLLQKLVQNMEKRDFHVFFGIAFLYSSILPVLGHYNDALTLNPDLHLPLYGGYILMLFLGYYFRRFGVKKSLKTGIFAVAALVLMTAFNVIATYFEYYKTDGTDYLFFDNRTLFPIVISGVCWFYLFMCIPWPEKMQKAASFVGSCTFGIYLLSDTLIQSIDMEMILYDAAAVSGIGVMLMLVVCELLVFAAGFGITAMLKAVLKMTIRIK